MRGCSEEIIEPDLRVWDSAFPTRNILMSGEGNRYKLMPIICERSKLFDKTYLSNVMRKPKMWFPNGSDTNQVVQAQKMARGLPFRI